MATTKKATSKKKSKKVQTSAVVAGPRRLKLPKRPSRKWRKRIKQSKPALTGAFRLFVKSLLVLKQNWKLFGGITLVYTILTLVLVRGFSSGLDLAGVKQSLNSAFKNGNELSNNFALFGVLLGSSGTTTSQIAGAYQSFITLLTSLALIWALRHVLADTKQAVGVKAAYYKSTHALIPFLLVLLVVGLQLVPFLVGGAIYGAVMNNGLAVTGIEKLLWAGLFFGLALVSLYMISSSIFALYIVTLPDMTPMKALRSAKKLVQYRRWMVLRKLVFLPIALLVIAACIMLPLIAFAAPVAEWVYFFLSMIALAVVHSYIYSLYRELLI